ncbi:flagellar brake protein [Caldimonas sp. KR1-144]|uniref:flagellar brake protein n=1 Tax=Caldimonas sp. KR1-144 TaxID=3400911 RepID=UPI003BFB5A9D
METLPMPLDGGRSDPGLDEFRVRAPAEVLALLRQLADTNTLLHLSTPAGHGYMTTLWALDPARGLISLAADPTDARLAALVDSDEAVAVGYLDSIKLQFDLQDLLLVHRGRDSALNARFPRELFRFQRRGSFRVKPLLNTRPVTRLRHPALPEMQLELRVVDVSISGIALFVPDNVPPVPPGVMVRGVTVELDSDTRFEASLTVMHVTQMNPGAPGARLGCELASLTGDAARALQRYIDNTQKRRRLLSI